MPTITDYLKYANLQMVGATLDTRTPNPSLQGTLRDEAAQHP